VFFARHIKFQYPPSSLLLFDLGTLFHLDLSNHMLNLINYAMLAIEAGAVGYVAYWAVRKLAVPGPRIPPWASWAIAIFTALLTLDFGPALVAAALGQVQTWINTLFVVACLCWLKDRRFLAGLCVGAICILKPQFALFVFWGLLRKERRFLAGWATVMVPALGVSLAVFGLANHLDYLAALKFMSRHGEVYYANQSLNGLLNRFVGNGNIAVFQPDEFPPFHPLVSAGTLISSIALIAGALLYRVRSRHANAIDFCIAGLTFTLASPIAWHHHYGILPVVLVLAAVVTSAISSPLKRSAFASALVVLWAFEGHWGPPSNTPPAGLGTLVQSSVFIAGLGVLWVLYLCRDTYAEEIAPRLEASPAGAKA
jgi:hypothetical protein